MICAQNNGQWIARKFAGGENVERVEFEFHDGAKLTRISKRGKRNIVPIVMVSNHVCQCVINQFQRHQQQCDLNRFEECAFWK
jgi:hypothetical protein